MPSSRFLPTAAALLLLSCLPHAGAFAQTAAPDHSGTQGLWLTTDYPELTEPAGSQAKISLTLRNTGLPPERVELTVEGLPDGWDWSLTGGGQDISAAMVAPDESRDLTLAVTPPKDAAAGTVNFHVVGHGASRNLDLPIALTLAAAEPAKLTLDPQLPALRGSPSSSFDFQVAIKNDSRDEATVNLLSGAPDGFVVAIKEQYGSQEITSLPMKAGESKTVKVSVQPPHDVAAGEYPVVFKVLSGDLSAQTQLVMQVTGQPKLALEGPGGRLSGQATAGKPETFTFTLANTGSAPATDVKLAASQPSGWKVTFSPDALPLVAPNADQQVQVEITPSDKAITGDYMLSLRANGKGASDSAQFRVTVATSTAWGIAGLGVIGAAVVALGFSVTRYGRR